MKYRHIPLSLEQKRDLKEAFEVLDSEKSGFIDSRDVKVAFRALGCEPKKDEIRSIVSYLDQKAYDGGGLPIMQNGRISFEAFVEIMSFKFNEEDNEDVLRQSYSLFANSSGLITVDSLKNAAADAGIQISQEELEQMIYEADTDRDGAVNEKEFIEILLS